MTLSSMVQRYDVSEEYAVSVFGVEKRTQSSTMKMESEDSSEMSVSSY
jgi:hypothetical protein